MTDTNRPMMYGQEVWADAETATAPIQRHEPRSPLCGNRCGRLVPNDNGSCVLYADHVEVLARAEAQLAEDREADREVNEIVGKYMAENAVLREALEAIGACKEHPQCANARIARAALVQSAKVAS